ncbi:hypothetical protein AVEN_159998-1, partial [Araneus ventricosus]
MDSSGPFPITMCRGRYEWQAFHLSSLHLVTTHPTSFTPNSEEQPAEIRSTSIEVVWQVTFGLGVRGLRNLIFKG